MLKSFMAGDRTPQLRQGATSGDTRFNRVEAGVSTNIVARLRRLAAFGAVRC
jgi:hypothetical protein